VRAVTAPDGRILRLRELWRKVTLRQTNTNPLVTDPFDL
jgi:hypothetical protein